MPGNSLDIMNHNISLFMHLFLFSNKAYLTSFLLVYIYTYMKKDPNRISIQTCCLEREQEEKGESLLSPSDICITCLWKEEALKYVYRG